MGGHLGINKTYSKITKDFYWPQIQHCVAEFCKTRHTCQMVGKPNQNIPVAPFKPIPAFEEPFSKVIIDCVGPLPKTKSRNQYLLTIMCASTRFPEAIPLEIQSDQGSNFMSGLFQQVVFQLGAKQIKSSVYHPESQGALERFHSTLKNMIMIKELQNRVFNPGGKISVSSPGQLNKLQDRDLGSCLVTQTVETLHWAIRNCTSTRLTRVCEMNMIKQYFERGIT